MKNDLRRLLVSLGDLAEPSEVPAPPGSHRQPPRASARAPTNGPGAQDAGCLLAAQRALAQRHSFEPGMLVRWKRTEQGLSLSNRMRPSAGELAVVVSVLDTPVLLVDEDVDSGHPTWREPLDLQLGLLNDNGDFLVYHFDTARFEPVSVQAARGQAARQLRELQTALAQMHTLHPGMLVRWKPHLKNRNWPVVGQAAVVLETLSPSLMDPQMSAASHYYREPLDLVLGVLLDGEFHRMHTDSRRFEPLPVEDDGDGEAAVDVDLDT